MLSHKICKDCKQSKPLTEFYQKTSKGLNRPPRYSTRCKRCQYDRTREYQTRPENVVKVLEYKRKYYHTKGKRAIQDLSYRKFNASAAAYDLQFHGQNGRCAVCLREPGKGEARFAFDHDHETGSARGVLCPSCNGGLGCFRDRPDLLQAAIAYLTQWEAVQRGIL